MENEIYQHKYKTLEIIDKNSIEKNVNKLIKEYITNEPKNEQEFIENQILLDQIIYEIYKGKEIKITNYSEFELIKKQYPYFEKHNCNIYSDESINVNSYKLLNDYYSKESASFKKLRFYFDFTDDFLKETKIRMIFGNIISKINLIANIPKKIMYITNIRREIDAIDTFSFDLFFTQLISLTEVKDIFGEKNISYLISKLNDSLSTIGKYKIKKIEIQNIISNYFICPIILKPILYPNINNYPKTNFEIIKKIDKNKNLKELIYEYITPESFKNPKNETTFIENQILLDQIIYEKYKDKEINFNDNIYRNNSAMEALLLYFENKKYKVYIDDSIDQSLLGEINKYYFNQNTFGKKIRLSLGIDGNIINDKDKLRDKVINQIILEIGKLTEVPKEKIFVTNVRNNCIICDIFFYIDDLITENFPRIKEAISNLFKKNQAVVEINNCLSQIQESLENNSNNIYNDMENRVEIHDIIENFVVNPGYLFDNRFDKPIGSFGIHSFWFFHWHEQFKTENGKKYFYPGRQWDGFGLVVRNHGKEIFDPNGEWCTAFSDLMKKQKSYNVQHIFKETLYDNNNRRYSLLLQCKIKKDQILFDDDNNNIIMLNDEYIVPYRLLRENIAD